MVVSAGGMFASTVGVVLALLGVLPNFVALAAVMSFVAFFEVGSQFLPLVVSREEFAARAISLSRVSC